MVDRFKVDAVNITDRLTDGGVNMQKIDAMGISGIQAAKPEISASPSPAGP